MVEGRYDDREPLLNEDEENAQDDDYDIQMQDFPTKFHQLMKAKKPKRLSAAWV